MAFYVADAVGHGMAASLLTMVHQTGHRAQAPVGLMFWMVSR